MNLQRAILRCLDEVGGRLMSTSLIHDQVHLDTGTDVSFSEVQADCEKLERLGQVTSVQSVDFGTRYAITDAGKVRMRAK